MHTDKIALACKFAPMDKEQLETVRAVIRQMMQATQSPDPTHLAKLADVAHTTLTRIMSEKAGDDGSEVTWTLSAKTWMKLSKASQVPVTFLGEKITVPSEKPGDRYIIKQTVPTRLLEFWELLGQDERNLVLTIVDAWAEKTAGRR